MIDPVLEKYHMKQVSRPLDFAVGDLVKVHYQIKEGNKERIQIFEGTVIAIKNRGVGKSFTVRRISFDVGVERIFPLYNPNIAKIEKVRSSKVRKSKLYFLRNKIGKAARLKEVKKNLPKDNFYLRAEEAKKAKKNQSTESTQNPQSEQVESAPVPAPPTPSEE